MTNPLLQADDQTCWTQFRQGNDVALGQLMTRHVAALYHPYGSAKLRVTAFPFRYVEKSGK
jgi:hypothetical protein